MYNNSIHNVTKYIPVNIKDTEDPELINEINLNIIKSMSRKLKSEPNITENDPLLLIDNIKLSNNNNINIRNKKAKKNFIIPCRYLAYYNSDLVKIIVDVNFKKILKKGLVYKCHYNLLTIVEDFAYTYYIKMFANDIIQYDDDSDDLD